MKNPLIAAAVLIVVAGAAAFYAWYVDTHAPARRAASDGGGAGRASIHGARTARDPASVAAARDHRTAAAVAGGERCHGETLPSSCSDATPSRDISCPRRWCAISW